MPKNSDLGQLKPAWIKEISFDSRIGSFELIFSPQTENHKLKECVFYIKKK